jgi:hypothetical protein
VKQPTDYLVVVSPGGAYFGQAARLAAVSGGVLASPSGSAAYNGVITGTKFTVEFQVTPTSNSTGSGGSLVGQTNVTQWTIQTVSGTNELSFLMYNSAGAATVNYTYTTPLTNGTTYNVAMSWDGADCYIFVNGALITTIALASIKADASDSLQLGGGTWAITVDELRVSNSCRYTTTYTPATAPFAKDANTEMLYHFDVVYVYGT